MNESQTNTLSRNTRWLVLGDLISRAVGVVAVIWLANYLDVLTYSKLSYVFAIANIGVILADGGLSTYITKQLPRLEGAIQLRWLRAASQLKLLLNGVSLICIVLAAVLVSDISFWIILLGALAIIGANTRVFLESWFRGWQIMEWDAISKIIASLLLALGIITAIQLEYGLLGVALCYTGSIWLSVLCTFGITKYKRPASRLDKNLAQAKTISLQAVAWPAWPFAASLAINALYNYFDSVMLGAYGFIYEVGIYTAVYKPIFFLTGIAGMVMSAHIPVISKLWHNQMNDNNSASASEIVTQVSRILIGLAVTLAWGGSVIAPELLSWLYKDDYIVGAPIFAILLWSTACIYIWAAYGNSLQAMDGERTYLRGFAYGLLITIVGNLLFIPHFGMYAAAFTTLGTQLFLVVYMRHALLKHTGWTSRDLPLWSFLIRANIAGVGMAFILWFVALPAGWAIMLGAILYILFSLGLRTLQNRDIIFLKGLLR